MTGFEAVLLGTSLLLLVIVVMQASTIKNQGQSINWWAQKVRELTPSEVEEVTVVEREAIDLQLEAEMLADYKAKRTLGHKDWRAP